MHRIAIAIALVLMVAACGGDDPQTAGETPATTEAAETTDASDTTVMTLPRPREFVLWEADDGRAINAHPQDAVSVRLPIEDPANPLWMISFDPDPSVLLIIDSLLWTPSEPGAEPSHFEFNFLVMGTGETRVSFSFGPITPTTRTVDFTVTSTER